MEKMITERAQSLNVGDLSVGDWVMVEWPDGERWRGRLTRLSVTGGVEVRCANGKHVRCSSDFISSIPITAEILEKNGFESTTKPNVFTLTHGKLQLYVSKELDGWTMSFVNFMERLCILQVIRKSYIHELQHALRLAGVDTGINL